MFALFLSPSFLRFEPDGGGGDSRHAGSASLWELQQFVDERFGHKSSLQLGFHTKGSLCDKCSRSPRLQKHSVDLQRIHPLLPLPRTRPPPLRQNGAACKSQLSPWRRPSASLLSRLSDYGARSRSLGECASLVLLFTGAGFSVSP